MATGKASGKKKGECPKSGCIKKVGSNWRVVSNKTGKLWPAKYKSRDSAKKALAAYHMHWNHVSAYCFNLHAIIPIFVKNMIYG